MVSCTSPVPGGRSTISSSVSPQSASISWVSACPTIGPRQAMALPGSINWPIDSTFTPNSLSMGMRTLSSCPDLLVCGAQQQWLRRAVDIGIHHADLHPLIASATAILVASVDLPTPPLPEPTTMILRDDLVRHQGDAHLSHAFHRAHGLLQLALQLRGGTAAKAAGIGDDRGDPVHELDGADHAGKFGRDGGFDCCFTAHGSDC